MCKTQARRRRKLTENQLIILKKLLDKYGKHALVMPPLPALASETKRWVKFWLLLLYTEPTLFIVVFNLLWWINYASVTILVYR